MARDETARRRVSGPIVRWLSGLLASVAMVAAVSGLVALLEPRVPPLYLLALYALGVVAIAMVWDTGLAVVNAVLAVTVFDYLFIPPLHTLGVDDMADVVALVVFLATAIVVGVPASRLRRAVLESARLSKELAACAGAHTSHRGGGRPTPWRRRTCGGTPRSARGPRLPTCDHSDRT
jgi:K+-sensing histidine kinase KdpD